MSTFFICCFSQDSTACRSADAARTVVQRIDQLSLATRRKVTRALAADALRTPA